MIFFYVKNKGSDGTKIEIRDKDGWVTIPILRPGAEAPETDASKVQLVSWNEIQYLSGSEMKRIADLDALMTHVIEIAKSDIVCKEMNKVAFERYGIYVFLAEGIKPDANNALSEAVLNDLKKRVFFEWSHPMIGNIANSPRVRPQTLNSQYISNWENVRKPFLDDITKKKIREIPVTDEYSLIKSGHDQVRICVDLTTLARAIIGEITTLGTRRIEKLFALDLSQSIKLYNAQKQFLLNLLKAFDEELGKQVPPANFFSIINLKVTEYVQYYFDGCTVVGAEYNEAAQKAFYTALVEIAVGLEVIDQLKHQPEHDQYISQPKVKDWLEQWKRLPKVIQCAVIQNSMWRFWYKVVDRKIFPITNWKEERFSIIKATEKNYSYCRAADKLFIPQLNVAALGLSWSWNRDEAHPATTSYRAELMPLWAGPSGHSHGHLGMALGGMKRRRLVVGGEEIETAAIVLSGLFTCWRLYYDKRITPVHTIAETYEASISTAMVRDPDLSAGESCPVFKEVCLGAPHDLAALQFSSLPDPFDIVLQCMKADQGVINPIRLMNTLKRLYYGEIDFQTVPAQIQFDKLKTLLEEKRGQLSEQFDIPLWSKPIVYAPEFDEASFKARVLRAVEGQEVYSRIKLFTLRNVHTYRTLHPRLQSYTFNRFIAKDEHLVQVLYEHLIMQLSQQKSMIVLNVQCPGLSDVAAGWKRLLLTDSMMIMDAQLSEQKEDKFHVAGKITILDFGEAAIQIHFSKSARGSIQVTADIEVDVETFTLSNYYKDLPQTINGIPVLGAVELKRPKQIQLDNNGISFDAELGTAPEFWESVKGVASLPDSLFVHCRMTSDGTSSVFAMDADLKGLWKLTDKLIFEWKYLKMKSGMNAVSSVLPCFSLGCKLNKFAVEAKWNIDSDGILLDGRFEEGEVFSLSEILALLGLPDDLTILPGDLQEELFGNLGLQQITFRLHTSTFEIQSMEFVISTEKPWTLFSDKITLQPYLCVAIEFPFCDEKREIDLQIQGVWNLGGTAFETSIHPSSGEISAGMQQGQRLDIQEATKSFAGGISLPDIEISTMSLKANYKRGSYEILLEADKCLEFTVCGVQVSISDVRFYLEYADKAMGQMQIFGTFSIGGIQLHLQGEYKGENGWKFSASGLTDREVNLQAMWKSLEAQLGGIGEITERVPDNFLTFRIGTLYTAYETQSGKFDLYIVLQEFKITERFVITSVLTEVTIGKSLESLKIAASFQIVGIRLMLDVQKQADGWGIQGGTAKDQKLAIGKLLSEFADSILGYSVTLPEPLQTFTINRIWFTYGEKKGSTSFSFDCSASFEGTDNVLASIFSVQTHVHIKAEKSTGIWKYGFQIACDMEVGKGQLIHCMYHYDAAGAQNTNVVTLSYKAKQKEDVVTLYDILTGIGVVDIDESWQFITQIGLSEAELSYDFAQSTFSGELILSSGGSLKVSLKLGKEFAYWLRVSSTAVISLSKLPIAGGMTEKLLPAKDIFTIKNLIFYASSQPNQQAQIPAGVCLDFTVCGEQKRWQIYETRQKECMQLESEDNAPKVMWMKLNKTVAIFTIHRMGLGLDGTYMMAVLDASLNVSPFTFTLYGAGVGVDLSDFGIRFYLSGFGIAFKNSTMSISGELKKEGKMYSGTLLIQVKEIAVFAAVQYSEDGSLLAYAVLSGRIGGPPAFLITGIALGFAYNKRVAIPEIEKIHEFPLVKGAMGKLAKEDMLGELSRVISDEKGEKFLAAGIKFTTFEIVESFVLLTVSFGKTFEMNLLGLSELTMPPHCPPEVTPLARAQLAIKASLKPEEGFFGVEARLTPESFILSKDCHLTGGFAFYLWFGGAHSGDFVITLGGYHPSYEAIKPAHYPDVPRLGFNWNIGSCINLNGEIYFALTPCAVMAGGRLSAIYTLGPLKAYFIAKADFYLSWKPFSYDVSIGIVLGAALRINLLFVSITLKLELGAMLHIWGPDFSGRARISLWIISFEIAFGANASQGEKTIEWEEFCTAFLPKDKPQVNKTVDKENAADVLAPLKLLFVEGLSGQVTVGKREYQCVRQNGVVLSVDSALPIHKASVNEKKIEFAPVDVCVKPMGDKGKKFISNLAVLITDSYGDTAKFVGSVNQKNLPTAMWGGSGELKNDVPCGLTLESETASEYLFPVKHVISLIDLYMKGATIIENAFQYMTPGILPSYTSVGTIKKFAETVNSKEVADKREAYLHLLGIKPEEKITLKKYAAEAENYLDEEVLTKKS